MSTDSSSAETRDLIDDLHRVSIALKNRDAILLKTLSNHTIDEATIYQDEVSVNEAILIY